MNYYELKQLQLLLKNYCNDIHKYDKNDIMHKINDELIENMAIIVNRHLEDGKTIEDIIRKKLEDRVITFLDSISNYSLKQGTYIKPAVLKRGARINIRAEI